MTLEAVARAYDLTDAEAADLAAFDAQLLRVAPHTNLVARSTLEHRWTRHHADSLQLWPLLPQHARAVLDIGAGGGFPGVPLAILARHRRPDLAFTLVDSVGKKARFLTDVCEALGLDAVTVVNRRVEELSTRHDVVTARAVAALPALLDLAAPRLGRGGTIVAPKGAKAEEELERARISWRFEANRVNSATDPDARILVITEPERVA